MALILAGGEGQGGRVGGPAPGGVEKSKPPQSHLKTGQNTPTLPNKQNLSPHHRMDTDAASAAVTIATLEAENAALKARLEKRMNNNLDRLKAFDKAHPEKRAAYAKKYREEHRDEINAKRREKRRAAAEARGKPTAVPTPPENPGVE